VRYTCDPNRGTGGPSIFGQASGDGDPGDGGVGDESRRYICDPNSGTSIGQTSGVGVGSQRYKRDPDDGDGLRSQACNPND